MSEKTYEISLRLNGREKRFRVEERETLLQVLRERAGLTGAKKGCDLGECGACTVILNGRAVNSCCVFAVQADGGEAKRSCRIKGCTLEGARVLTIEGVADGERLHPIQQAFIDAGAVQCGFCTPGMILAAKALLDREPRPSRSAIRQALSGNLCRCTGYEKIEQAVERAAEVISGDAERGGEGA